MSAIDEERILKGPRDWLLGIAGGSSLISLILSTALFVFPAPTSYSSLESQNQKIATGISTTVSAIVLWLLYRYYQHLYWRLESGDSGMGYAAPTPNKCIICGRHPISRKYHIRKIHRIKDGMVQQYFENCGCIRCVKPLVPVGV